MSYFTSIAFLLVAGILCVMPGIEHRVELVMGCLVLAFITIEV